MNYYIYLGEKLEDVCKYVKTLFKPLKYKIGAADPWFGFTESITLTLSMDW